MRLTRQLKPFDHPEWVFELKYDGFRAMCYVEGGNAMLVSRNGNTFKSFPDLCERIAGTLKRVRNAS